MEGFGRNGEMFRAKWGRFRALLREVSGEMGVPVHYQVQAQALFGLAGIWLGLGCDNTSSLGIVQLHCVGLCQIRNASVCSIGIGALRFEEGQTWTSCIT